MKRSISLLLCLVMLTSNAGAAGFQDVPSNYWAYDAIQKMADQKVIEGIGNGKFAPTQPVNYASFVTMLAKAFYPAETAAQGQGTPWWRPYAVVLSAQELTSGTKLVNESVWAQVIETPISRNEMAVLIYNLAVKQGFTLPGASAVQAARSGIADFDAIPSPYRTAVATCYAAKLLTGGDGGKFNGENTMTRAEAAAVMSRLLDLREASRPQSSTAGPLKSGLDWKDASRFGRLDNSVSRPKTGYAIGYYTIANGDGTVSGLVVNDGTNTISVERFDASGNVVSTKELSWELPIFGTFFAGKTYNYLVFGQMNENQNDSQEVWRVVQYDKAWNRVGAVSANGGQTYTKQPFRSTVARMAETEDGSTVVLYAARTRYDGHQSNITFLMNATPFQMQTIMGEEFPSNHVSHSFGQFVQFDGDTMVTVDHGDAYPRAFVLQADGKELELFKFAGNIGENVTNAIGSGFECSKDGYLFLGCSTAQTDSAQNWKVALFYTDKNLGPVKLNWLTDGSTSVKCARLVKLDDNTFTAMWGEDNTLYYQVLDGSGQPTGQVETIPNTPMPPTQPVVQNGRIYWIQCNPSSNNPCLYTLAP